MSLITDFQTRCGSGAQNLLILLQGVAIPRLSRNTFRENNCREKIPRDVGVPPRRSQRLQRSRQIFPRGTVGGGEGRRREWSPMVPVPRLTLFAELLTLRGAPT